MSMNKDRDSKSSRADYDFLALSSEKHSSPEVGDSLLESLRVESEAHKQSMTESISKYEGGDEKEVPMPPL